MRVLVTGGAGYIGSHTVRHLTQAGFEPIIFDNFSRGHLEAVKGFKVVTGDTADTVLLSDTIKKYDIAAVVHFAAHSQVGESVKDPALYYDNNVGAGLKLLTAVRQAGVKYFVFSSSAAVYGEPRYVPIDEGHMLSPANPYGQTKAILEKILSDYNSAYGLKSVSLRYFNAAGAAQGGEIGEDHEPETHLIPLVLKAVLGQMGKLTVFGNDYPTGDGTAVRDYIHVDDLARAHVLALDYLINGGETVSFNLGNGEGFSVLDVIYSAEKVTGMKVPFEIGGRRAGDPAVLVAGNKKIKQLLGWQPEIPQLEEIIRSAWEWHRRHPNGF